MGKNSDLGLTYDDVLLLPDYADLTRATLDLRTQLTREITLDIPVVSAPMDTVTEYKLALTLGQRGGIGFIHRNLHIDDQAQQVEKVKQENVLVGAAIGSADGFEKRADALVEAGVDVLLIDTAHGHVSFVLEALKRAKKRYKVQIIAGNIATKKAAEALTQAGADGLRVGMGPGAICTTRIISGMGVPQITALRNVRKYAKKANVPFIADGGINYTGDMAKAIAAGASSVMLGRMLVASEESAGKAVVLEAEQVPDRFKSILNGADSYTFKEYRGMGSPAAMARSREINAGEEFHGKLASDKLVAEGVEGLVPCAGPVDMIIDNIIEGLKSGMYYTGSKSIHKLQKATLTQITQASLQESHPHDLLIVNGGGNY